MPSAEQSGPAYPEEESHREREPTPFHRAARFAGERSAGEAYFAAQQVIYEAPQRIDVSVFRLQLNQLWHVAALGVMPPATVLHAIEAVLDTGEPTELPAEVWQASVSAELGPPETPPLVRGLPPPWLAVMLVASLRFGIARDPSGAM